MTPVTRNATLKQDKTKILKMFLTAGFWESLGRYLKNAAAAVYRGELLISDSSLTHAFSFCDLLHSRLSSKETDYWPIRSWNEINETSDLVKSL